MERMMKKVLAVIVALWLSTAATVTVAGSWSTVPWFEYRHTVLSTEPSLIGSSGQCPCYGFEALLGMTTHPLARSWWTVEMSAGIVGQTRYDDPEVYHFRVLSQWDLGRRVSLRVGYREKHNLDRPTPSPHQFVTWRGLEGREPGGLWWGKSSASTLWVGIRVNLW